MGLLIVNNPTSGGRSKNQKVIRLLQEFLTAQNAEFELVQTVVSKNATAVLKGRKDYDQLIIVGGDGTINEAVNGLEIDVPVSIIAAGTGNDFVKNIPLAKSLDQQFARILTGDNWQVDVGICNGRKFTNGIGVGFDGQIVHDMNGKKVPILKGHAKYYYHVLTILASYRDRPFFYSIDGSRSSSNLILMTIGNGTTYGGGFRLMPDAKIDDGKMEICSIGPMSGLRRFLNVSKITKGTHGVLKEVEFGQAEEVFIEENELLYAHMDGEDIGKPPFDIKVLPKSLTLRI